MLVLGPVQMGCVIMAARSSYAVYWRNPDTRKFERLDAGGRYGLWVKTDDNGIPVEINGHPAPWIKKQIPGLHVNTIMLQRYEDL